MLPDPISGTTMVSALALSLVAALLVALAVAPRPLRRARRQACDAVAVALHVQSCSP